MEGNRAFEDLRLTLERWAYNNIFEFWQIRKPERAFTTALATIRQMAWTGERFQLSYFNYPFYGGVDDVFRLSRRLGREGEFFELLQYLIDVMEEAGAIDQDLAEAHQAMGYYLGKAGRHDEALIHFTRSRELDAGMPAYQFSEVVGRFKAGERIAAAERLFEVALELGRVVSMDNIRFLYQDYPEDGVDFLLSKLAEHPNNNEIAGNLAILAIQAGEIDLARTALILMEANQSGEEYAGIAKQAAEAVAAGNLNEARSILSVDTEFEISQDNAYIRAMLSAVTDEPEDVGTDLETAIRLGPYERDPDFPLFETYFTGMHELGRVDEAFAFLRGIVNENQNDPYPYFFLCHKLRESGQLDEAKWELENLRNKLGPMQSAWVQFQMLTIEGSSGWWFRRLNWVDANDVNRELGRIAYENGDMDNVRHHLYWAESSRPEKFYTYMLAAKYEMEKGDLKEAGEILDNASFFPEVEDRKGEAFKALMAAYTELKAAGWVRERNFDPFPGIPGD
jgi:tetratricopeptide (TPR) repeat protein